MKSKDWKRVPGDVIEIEGEDGKHFYYKTRGRGAWIRYHGGWWTPVELFLDRHPNLKLPERLKTLLNIYFILRKYDLK